MTIATIDLETGRPFVTATTWADYAAQIAAGYVIAHTFPSDEEWTVDDNAAAYAEGWNLWDSEGSDNGRTQLCRCDEEDIFTDAMGGDDDAAAHVVAKAREGSVLHIKALRLVAKHNPAEAAAITKGTGFDFSTIAE